MYAKLHTVAASKNSDHPRKSLYCLFPPHIYIVVLRVHPVRGKSHIQRNATGEVATVPINLKSINVTHSFTGHGISGNGILLISFLKNLYRMKGR